MSLLLNLYLGQLLSQALSVHLLEKERFERAAKARQSLLLHWSIWLEIAASLAVCLGFTGALTSAFGYWFCYVSTWTCETMVIGFCAS